MEKQSNLTLYHRENCPYCQLVRKKLMLLDQSVMLVPVEKNGGDRKELIEISGQQEVPVLVDDGQVFVGSQKILSYLNETFGTGEAEPMPSNNYGLSETVSGSFQEVMEKTVEALKTEGFGVLTEIDVKSTLKKKLNVDVPQQVILGACNPGFAHQAMSAETDISLLLPCNVTVRQTEDNRIAVTAVNPLKLLSVIGREDLMPVAKEVKNKMQNVLNYIVN